MTYTEIISLVSRFIHRINDVDIAQFCGLAKSVTSTKLKTTVGIVYNLLNQQASLVVTDPITMTACVEQAVNTFCYYLVSINLAGTVIITKGTNNTYALPDTPALNVAIGAVKITTDITHTFTSGTTALDAAGITAQFFDIDAGIATTLVNFAMRRLERKHNFNGMKFRYTYSLVADTIVAFNNPIPFYKSLESRGGAYGLLSGRKYQINKQDLDSVEGAFLDTQKGPPALIAEIPANESSLSPDISPNLQWLIRPVPDVTYDIIFTGYQYTPFLDGVIYSHNWWTDNHSDILLYAALLETEPYLKEDSRIEVWKNVLIDKLNDLILSESEEEYSGSSKYGQGN